MATEKRLIDANAFLSSMIKRFKCVPLIGRNDYDCESLKQMLIEAPTVDAVEVVHGRWNESDWSRIRVNGYMVCSACNVMIPKPDGNRYCLHKLHYCPNCGAKMDGDGNG